MTWFIEDLDEETETDFMQAVDDNLLATRTIKKIHEIKDKSLQDKIVRIIRILAPGKIRTCDQLINSQIQSRFTTLK